MADKTQLVGFRELAEYADKARSTVRGWCERSSNPMPYTTNEQGHYVFEVAAVDEWLETREDTPEDQKAEAKAVQLATAAEKLRGMELDNDEREFKKNQREKLWQHRDEYTNAYKRRYLQITAMVDQFIESEKKMIPNLSASQSEEIDRRKVEFFNSVADLPRL